MTNHTRRTALLGLAAVTAFPAPAYAMRLPRVLFVCQAGTVKSAVARELMRKRARERGIGVTVWSRGIVPVDHMTAPIRQRLIGEFGIDPENERAKTLRQRDLDRADITVLLDTLPANLHKSGAIDWTDQPSLLNAFDASMAYLEAHVAGLLNEKCFVAT